MAITDEAKFEIWLDSQPQEVCATIAARAAARVLPFATHSYMEDATGDLKTIAFITARAILSSGAALKTPASETLLAARSACSAIDLALSSRSITNSLSAGSTFGSPALFAAYSSASLASSARSSTNWAARAAKTPALIAAYADTEHPVAELFLLPIWPESTWPDSMQAALEGQYDIFADAPEYAFWREWYDGLLTGKPLDWELQRRVAVIPDADWEQGPEHIAERIEVIRAKYEVETRAAELEKLASEEVQRSQTRGIGDNNPPETREAEHSNDPVTIIWASARDLREEAQAKTPDKGKVRQSIDTISKVLKACGLWAAKKLDLGIDAAMKVAGAAGATYGIAWLTQNADKIAEFLTWAQKWLVALI